jgi:hypothetical protein
MAYGIGARLIDHAGEQDEKIPIGLGMGIAMCTRTIENDVCFRSYLVYGLFDALKEFLALRDISPGTGITLLITMRSTMPSHPANPPYRTLR